ncbi:hypothetical protein GCM10010275_21230 [Streptomyces litmocidini]|uniref:hypothetical protein n=1 Tax=Streptomyces litmocidini TaxID=67318 RepID=UPI00199AF613|nr:hypothetical protein [Streptomyces litmocidini]GGU85604.1 hypothetical protein GCM10010275_21230 [Streptomyces litmocidini]
MPSHELAGNAAPEESERESAGDSPNRRTPLIAGIALLGCIGLAGYGFLGTDGQPKPRTASTAEVTNEVTYEVTGTGTVEISYLTRGGTGTARVEKGVTLPWTKSVQVPVGKAPAVAIVLDEKGGQASCTLAIRDKHVQRATAAGAFGRATCTGGVRARQE